MRNNNLNVPAILVKKVKGREKLLSGRLVRINESSQTCSMVFKDGKMLKNIPMKYILINEGFLDKFKEYGQKVVNFVKKTVKGFFVLVDEVTGKFITWSTLTVANTAKMAAKGQLPTGIYFAPSASMAATAGVKGLSIDEAMAEAMNNDRIMIEKYWRRVIKRAGTTNEPIEESVKFVNENYYTVSNAYKQLNEAVVYTLDDIKSEEGVGGYGTIVDAKQLKRRLIQNITLLISGTAGKHADIKPLLIWGAPGIGKTAIINSTIKEMANRKVGAVNLSLVTIMLAGYTIENWTLPSLKSTEIGRALIPNESERFTDCPKTWLPVYLKTSDPAEAARRDHYCNTGEYRGESKSADGRAYEGGIVFMDEYSRTVPNVQNIIMGLTNEHKFGDDYVVASKWGFVFAANRSYDDNNDELEDKRYYPVAALNDRFFHYTYVPKMEDWLEWARTIDPITHKANVPPFITEFISLMDTEHIWYSTVVNGGYDDILSKYYGGDKAKVKSSKEGKMSNYSDIAGIDSFKMLKRLVTPRTWANTIGPTYEEKLIELLEGNSEGISGKEKYLQLIDKSIIQKTDQEGNSYKEYYGGILPKILIDALNDIDAEYWEAAYDLMGGDDELDPAHTLRGRTARFQKFMAWVRILIAEAISDDTKNSPLLQSYDSYNEVKRYMTDEVILHIWENGTVPPENQADDDFMPSNGQAGYNNIPFASWKLNTMYIKDVFTNMILPSYPGDIYEDMAADVHAMENSKTPTNAEGKEIFPQLSEKTTFAISVNGEKPQKLSFFFVEGKDVKTAQLARNFVQAYRDSTVVLKLLNIFTYAAKVGFQVGQNQVMDIVYNDIKNKLENCPDIDIVDKFMKRNILPDLKAKLGDKFKQSPEYLNVLQTTPMILLTHMQQGKDEMKTRYVKLVKSLRNAAVSED